MGLFGPEHVAMAAYLFNVSRQLRKAGLKERVKQPHAMKIAFEKYFLWKARHGYVNLP
jgi:hypothetical protein